MKTESRHFYILLILFLFLVAFNEATSQRIDSNVISKFSTEEGLSSNVIYNILQDSHGLIWIATEEGLNKFEGKSFTHFTVNNGRHAISHNRTQALLLAPDGNVWAGTSDGLNIYDYRTDSIIKVRTNTSPLKLIYNDITYLSTSPDKSKIWIGTYGNGVNYFDWQNQKFYGLTLPGIKNIPPPLQVMSILEDDNRRLWIGTQRAGLYRYNIDDKKLDYFYLPENSRYIRSIFQDSFRRIWIGTSKGCYIYNETSNHLELINYPASLIGSSVGVIKEDHNGKIWIGTETFLMNFLVRSFSLKDKFPFQTVNQGESTSKLSCPSVNSLFADQDNNLWIGTAWGGLNMLKGTTTKFKLFKHDSEISNSIPNSPLTAVCLEKNGNLIIGTMGTDKIGLFEMDIQSGLIKVLAVNKKLSGYIYQAVFVDSENNLWAGTYNKGLVKINSNRTDYIQFSYDNKKPKALPSNDIRTIFESKDKTIWIGTSNGLAKFDKNSKSIIKIDELGSTTLGIRSIKEAEDGILWIGTYGGGILTYNYKNKKVNLRPINVDIRIVSDIAINGDYIWLATQGEGLFLYNKRTKRSACYNEANGLSSNHLSSVLCDNNSKVWFGSSRGISSLDPKTKEIENFNSGDGIQTREFTDRSAVKLPNGTMAFAGFGGINIFNPLNVTKNDKCPPVIFTKLLVFNELITPSEGRHKYSPLKENISIANTIDLKYNQSVFTIEFVGINYNANQKIQYAYFLEGSDKKWNQLGNQNSVTFRKLESGKYVFKVKASSPDAVWNDNKIASIIIIVRPPWWKTFWAYLLYLIIIGATLYFVWMFLTLRIRTANHLKIERAKREKEEELHQEKLQFFTNISHEFRTPLTLIIGPLEKMHQIETEVEKKAHLKLMLRNAKRLLGMVNQLLDFRKAERGQLKLKVQNMDVVQAINEILNSFTELSIQKDIKLEFIHKEDILMAWFDVDFLNKSLYNLLSNAFKFTPNAGNIILEIKSNNDLPDNKTIEITLTDNGKGILPRDIDSIFERFYQGKEESKSQIGSGIGLHLTKSLIELHHGTIDVESIPNEKTTFRIILPIEKSAYLDSEFMDEPETTGNGLEIENFAQINNSETEKNVVIKTKINITKRILIVEDNEDIRSYVQSILSDNYVTEEAANGAIALEMVALNDYDLIITDLMMPEMDGIEMCKRLKSSIETDHIPIIMLTAKSDIENRIEGLKIGADAYITKPFHPEHLSIRVAKLVELRDLLKERYSRKISLGELHKPNTNSASPDEFFLQKTISIILEKMIESEFNGDALAYELGISRMGLHRKIKALSGQSTGEFIRNIRLKKACELLVIQGKNISEVCYDVGFNSPSYFTTCFTEVYKMTPKEYVKKMKMNEN